MPPARGTPRHSPGAGGSGWRGHLRGARCLRLSGHGGEVIVFVLLSVRSGGGCRPRCAREAPTDDPSMTRKVRYPHPARHQLRAERKRCRRCARVARAQCSTTVVAPSPRGVPIVPVSAAHALQSRDFANAPPRPADGPTGARLRERHRAFARALKATQHQQRVDTRVARPPGDRAPGSISCRPRPTAEHRRAAAGATTAGGAVLRPARRRCGLR
jgi:hypothetical protein